MNIQAIEIQQLRSIQSCRVSGLGPYNVLIGKNNSGKSNIFYALSAFFSTIRRSDIIDLDPSITENIDFHHQDIEQPIRIVLTFRFDDIEWEEILENIYNVAPEFNFHDMISDNNTVITVSVTVTANEVRYAYVDEVSYKSGTADNDQALDYDITILRVTSQAAEQLRRHRVHYNSINAQIKNLQAFKKQFTLETWQHFKEQLTDNAESPVAVDTIINRIATPAHILEPVLDSLISDETYQQFQMIPTSSIEGLQRVLQSYPLNHIESNAITTLLGEQSEVPEYVFPFLRAISKAKVLTMGEDARPITTNDARRLLELKNTRGGQATFEHIQDVVSSLIGTDINAFVDDVGNFDGSDSAELDVGGFIVDVNGSGVKNALRTVLDIEFQQPDIVLIEEPELHLHPGLEIDMMKYLQRICDQRQLLITSHSTNFVAKADHCRVFVVSNTDSTTVQSMQSSEFPEYIPDLLGMKLNSLFFYERLVFVESESDERILRAWAETLDLDLTSTNVGFVRMNGSRSLTTFAAGETLSFLKTRQMKIFFLIDRDERTEREIERLQKQVGDNGVVHVLEQREIENYLINPRLLFDWIVDKREGSSFSGENPRDPDAVRVVIENYVKQLKAETVFRRVIQSKFGPFYADRSSESLVISDKAPRERALDQIQTWEQRLYDLKTSIDESVKIISGEVDEIWDEMKLRIVPGDELIKMVADHYSVPFDKTRDHGVELAKNMTKDEIDVEIATMLKSIVE